MIILFSLSFCDILLYTAICSVTIRSTKVVRKVKNVWPYEDIYW